MKPEAFADDSAGTRFPVKKTQISSFEDLKEKNPIDLRDPSNIKTDIEYDIRTNTYLFKTKIGDNTWVTPFTLEAKEYNDYTLKESMANYFKIKNAEAFEKGPNDEESSLLKDIKLNLGAAEKIFGPGGVKVKPQGYAELTMGIKRTSSQNPTISERNRTKTLFDFDEKIQLNVAASVGDKVNFDLNYDTEASFDFDSKKIKLAYEGKEDEIIKYIEAGNVSLNTTNSLISGSTALFGVRADLQFGKLRVNTVISQQESESQSVKSEGGVQKTPFEFKADAYDENRHFFFGYYFRHTYDEAMSTLPFVQSPIKITKIEAWVTNKRGNFDQSRNIVAFADLAENKKEDIKNSSKWSPIGALSNPFNGNNTLYGEVTTALSSARDISQTTQTLTAYGLESGLDYEKIESARLLSSTEYTFNAQLGYISTNFTLQSDEVLAVAYEYTMGGKTYQVGEFAANITDKYEAGKASGALFLKLLKPVSLSPYSYSWDLMMKNIYSLGAYQVQSDRFRLNITYQNDTTGTYVNYISEGNIKDEMLLRVMNLDRLDSRQNKNPDGIFDFIEGLTIISSNGRVIFPEVEPFGEHLRKKIGNDQIADKYVYQQLYDSTLTVARQIAEKNKFKISGSYKASNTNEINLNATNVARGSVRVTAGGATLVEGTDYIVDYTTGSVTVINQGIIDAGTPVNVSLENQSFYNMQRKTLLGLNLSYEFNKDFNIGATIMHMFEKPLTMKTEVGNESVKNTLWGLNTSYRKQSQWLTDLIDKLPFVEATAPSQISFNAEFAQMLPGHYKNKYSGGYSYLDDFESSRSRVDIRNAYGWSLASTPQDRNGTGFYEKASLSNQKEYGDDRAHLAWFMIDNLFTRRNSSLTPSHIKNDKDQLSNHYVREIRVSELYPNRDALYNESATISALNLSYYPEQRGPYNLDDERITSEGKLKNPETRWGGISRKMDIKDFEANNIEYIEFWLMDPFVYNDTAKVKNEGGELYFNLGEISEDVLKDGRKFFENGLPITQDTSLVDYTVWGKVPKRQSTVYAFDSELGMAARRLQDVGFNGLSTEEEFQYPTYANYLEALRQKITDGDALAKLQNDPHSPFNDPAGDNYHHYRGSDYDRDEVSILDRYKYYNNTEGNSIGGDESYSTAAKSVPDVEDIDQDYTLNETESYFQYKINLKPSEMMVGHNFITDSRDVSVDLANGKTEHITWYQFKVPIKEYNKTVGNIRDFKSIRFMRLYLTNFKQTTFLRFGTMELVRGDWRVYTQDLNTDLTSNNGTINISSVNIEENGNKEPVNYILPPGVTRILDPSQPQLRQENEQSLSFQILNLDPNAARAIYKNTSYDLRRYKRIQMFTHAESLIGPDKVSNGELTVFLRLGSDYKNNYYEYEIPLTITPPGKYNGNNINDQLTVWPAENMFDFSLSLFKDIKLERNREKRKAGSKISFTDLFHRYDPEKPANKVSVIGNPSLSDVNVIMIGVRNNSRTQKSGEIWVNELRLTDFDEEGGWAAQGNLNVALSDIGTVNISGRKETVGFGSIEQSLMERRSDDYTTYNIATNVDLGRFLPEKAQVSIPMYYAYSNETTTPKYDPLDQDVTLKESMSTMNTKAQKDSIKSLAQDKTTTRSFSLSNVKVNIKSKTPMPYDPANFTFGYSQSITEIKNPTTVYDQSKDYKASFSYNYSPMTKTWSPFEKSKSKAPMAKFAKTLGFNYLPTNISFNSFITRFYTETMTRDIESYALGENNSDKQFLSWSQNFYWDRDFSLSWDFTKNLKASIQTGTKAEIEEPYLQVNKKLNPGDYEIWKDSVMRSIKNFGTPLSYRQTAKVTYNVPLKDIPFLDWITTSSVDYNSNYTWDRGAKIDTEYEIGNTIANNMTLSVNGRFNMLTLYNKSSFLKKVNQKFSMTPQRGQQRPGARPAAKKTLRRVEREVTLSTDSATIVQHGLNTKNIVVSAKGENGRTYAIKFKKLDSNRIRINTKDSAKIKVTVLQGKDAEETLWYKIAEYSARGLMSLRSISVNYSQRNENYIYGFRPGIADAFGQSRSDYGLSPGLGFAFGMDGGEDYIEKAMNRDWLIKNEMNVTPAIYNSIEKLNITAQIEPVKGLKIDLSALREKNDRTEFQYMYTGMPKTYGGSFTMSIISLSSALESTNAKDGYKSKAFEKFLSYRSEIAQRLEKKYQNTSGYPNSGFIQDLAGVGNSPYNPSVYGGVNENSADAMIPAFLAAYTGQKPGKVSLSPFPALSAMMPNWTISYDGLTTMPWFKDKFKNIKLSHGYTSQYRVGSYQSFSGWVDAGGDGLGYIENVLTGMPNPSSPYDINSVSIVEQFNPLFGADGTLNNNMTLNAKYNTQRTINLNVSSYQIVESRTRELVLGMGYRINEFNRVIGMSSRSQKGFNNDLVIKADISHRMMHALIRKIEEQFTQATSGSDVTTIKLSADYSLSKALTLRAFFDRILNKPLISASSYPTTNTNFGISLRFTLTE